MPGLSFCPMLEKGFDGKVVNLLGMYKYAIIIVLLLSLYLGTYASEKLKKVA